MRNVERHPLLCSLMWKGDIVERGELFMGKLPEKSYVLLGRQVYENVQVALGRVHKADEVEAYLKAHPTPDTWDRE